MPFFVILDEAIGDREGDIELHFPMAPGNIKIDNKMLTIITGFEDANLMIKIACNKQPVSLLEEDGWHAWGYNQREKRTAVTAVYRGPAPVTFVSLLVPYRGKSAPICRLLNEVTELTAGKDPVIIQVELGTKKYLLERRLHNKM